MEKEKLPHFDVLPKHVAFIMDGNGRWAKQRGLERSAGHREGAKTFRKICDYAADIGIEYLTFYAFSTENWRRPQNEVDALMNLFRDYLAEMQEREEENEERGYNIRFIGDISAIPDDIQKLLDIVEKDSDEKTKTHINIAVNYGGRHEIVSAVKKIVKSVKSGNVSEDDIDEKMISENLYTAFQPDPDLVIRPSGEQRLSNFLIWQSAYAEFWYSDVLWPDFSPEDLNRALDAFQNRNRRFGGV